MHDPAEAPEIEGKFNEIWGLYEREPYTEKLSIGPRGAQPPSHPSPPAPDLQTSTEKPASINQENLELGMAFEEYVRGLLTVDFEVLAWNKEGRGKDWEDYGSFDFRIRDIVQGKEFFLECMYRRGMRDGKLFVAKPDKLEKWREVSERLGMPVCIMIGVGGEPKNPSRMFCFDLREIRYADLYPSFFEKREVDPREPITSDSLSFLFDD
ncbi:MAG: hypothetical protein ACO0C9_03595 [Candidatus Methanosuratincola verstraetei]